MFKRPRRTREDHRGSHFATDFEDRLDRLGVMNVKGRNGIALCLCVLQKIFGGNNTHEPVLLSLPRMNNDALDHTVNRTAGGWRIWRIANVQRLGQCEDLGVHQEAERLLHIVK